jgi:sulfide:quinone oxidoreductase
VSCTGTTIKPLLLAAAFWQRAGRAVDSTLIIDRPRLLDAPELDAALAKRLQQLKIRVRYDTRIASVDGRSVTTGTGERIDFDVLHLVPPFRGPRWLEESGLTAPESHGLVDVDPLTLRHRRYPNVWACGDGAALQTDPSGGALRRQVKILVDNLLAARRGGQLDHYDGYTVAPVTTDRYRLIAGEFDRTGAISSSLPSFVDPVKPRRTAWAFDRFVLPQTYWHQILKGRV